MKHVPIFKSVAVIIFLLIFSVIWNVSRQLDIPVSVMADVLIKTLTLFPLFLLVRYLLKIRHINPAFIYAGIPAGAYTVITPILNNKAMSLNSETAHIEPEFWGTTPFHFIVFVLLFVIGYGLVFYIKRKVDS